MIPGTLRPLPKKVKEIKNEAVKIQRISEIDLESAKEMLKESSLYTFEEINLQYTRIIDNHATISPLVKEAEKLLNKYINDSLLNELVYKHYRDLERTQFRLHSDSQRLETILMSKRRLYIEEMIPRLKDETRSKLSFLKDLSFNEILEKSQIYGNTISEIIGKLNSVKDEYQKLSDGSFDVSEFYAYLKDRIEGVEEELDEYDLILRTCKMQLLSEEAEGLVEEGNVITNEFEIDQSSEQVLKVDEFVKKINLKLDEMSSLRINLPRRGISKDFSSNFKELQQQYEKNQGSLTLIRDNLEEKTIQFSTQINWINTIREIAESDGEEINDIFKHLQIRGTVFNLKMFDVKERELRIHPKIKLRGTFKISLLESSFPVFELSPLGLVKLPLGDEMTTEKLEDVLGFLDEISKTAFSEELRNRRKARKLLKAREQREGVFTKIAEKLSPIFNKTKEKTKAGLKKTSAVSKKRYSKTQTLVKRSSDKEDTNHVEDSESITAEEEIKETETQTEIN